MKQNPAALGLLAGLSFAYGVFHAAGPGHGKAVISSYLVATGEGFRRGVALSALAALAQALAAIALVGLFAVDPRRDRMDHGARDLLARSRELHAAILAVGAVLLVRGRAAA